MKLFLTIFIFIVFSFSSSVYSNDYLCFETNDKKGEMDIVVKILFKKNLNNYYELSFPDYPENGLQTFDIIYEDNEHIILNLSGKIKPTAYSFNIIIDKDDLTFGSASLITPIMFDNMELTYGTCNKL